MVTASARPRTTPRRPLNYGEGQASSLSQAMSCRKTGDSSRSVMAGDRAGCRCSLMTQLSAMDDQLGTHTRRTAKHVGSGR